MVDQQLDFFISSLDKDSLFTNISLKETIEIYPNKLFKKSETVERLSRSWF